MSKEATEPMAYDGITVGETIVEVTVAHELTETLSLPEMKTAVRDAVAERKDYDRDEMSVYSAGGGIDNMAFDVVVEDG